MNLSTRLTRSILSSICLAVGALAVASMVAISANLPADAQPATPKAPPAVAKTVAPKPTAPLPKPTATPIPPPPLAQAYVSSIPGARLSNGSTLVPLSFLSDGLGASTGRVDGDLYRIVYFGHSVDVYANQMGARFDGQSVTLPTAPQVLGGQLFVPFVPLAQLFGVKWSISDNSPADKTTFLLQFPAAYIQDVRRARYHDKLRVVVRLSNATRVTASQKGAQTLFQLAAARRPNVPGVLSIGDYLVPRISTTSGNWRAQLALRTNYQAPVRWFTLGNPPRLVIDAQRLFEERRSNTIEGGMGLTKIRKGTPDGPVQMFVVRFDPQDGWRVRVAPAGFGVLQRARPSRIASRHKALVAVNGGFFSYDGAAVGAVLVDGEWIRLPWKARTAIAFDEAGRARIGNLQVQAKAAFSGGMTIPVRDLNGWPDVGKVSVLTPRFGTYYKLRSGEMAVEVKDGIVVSKPGSGGVQVHAGGWTLVASGGARPYLDKVARGEGATLSVQAPGWESYVTALGGGPRLLKNGQVQVTALREAFRTDVRIGRGPRTAIGIDREGRYIILVADGRRPYYSIGMTLTELAYTMQSLGAVEALNLDGGGSTAMAVKNHVVNRPSDGSERSVSNALLVMR